MKKTLLGMVSAMILAACANQGTSQTQTAPLPHPNEASIADQTFTCRNGATLTVRHNVGTDKIRVSVNTIESSVILSLAQSASGLRYANANGFYNKPTEFHFKNKEGTFAFQDPYGNKINTVCRSK